MQEAVELLERGTKQNHNRKATSIVARLVILALMAAPMLVLPGISPALGSEIGGGTIAFTGTASLPKFPKPASDPATGTFTGTVAGHLYGYKGTTPWDVVFSGATGATPDMRATFTYSEPACVAPVPAPAQGTAAGTATVQVGSPDAGDSVIGLYGTTPVTDVHAHITFTWDRTGLTAVLLTRATVTLTFAAPLPPVQVITDHLDVATAAFDPHASDNDFCDGDAITADVVGVDEIEYTGEA